MTVTVQESWTVGNTNGRRNVVVRATCVSAGSEGAVAGDIPVTVFGLRKVYAVKKFVSDADGLVLAAPSYDGESIITYEGTDAANPTAADLAADTYEVIVEGYR